GPLAAVAAELFGTAILLTAIVAATNRQASRTVTAAIIGLALSLGMLMSMGISGGARNPARSLRPQLLAAHMTYWWVYLLGPFLGAILLGGLVRLTQAALSSSDGADAQPQTQVAVDLATENLELQQKAAQAAAQLR